MNYFDVSRLEFEFQVEVKVNKVDRLSVSGFNACEFTAGEINVRNFDGIRFGVRRFGVSGFEFEFKVVEVRENKVDRVSNVSAGDLCEALVSV